MAIGGVTFTGNISSLGGLNRRCGTSLTLSHICILVAFGGDKEMGETRKDSGRDLPTRYFGGDLTPEESHSGPNCDTMLEMIEVSNLEPIGNRLSSL